MEKFLKWLVEKRAPLWQYFGEKKPACTPEGEYWTAMYSLKRFLDLLNDCFLSLQRLTTPSSQQRARVSQLVSEISEDGCAEGPCNHFPSYEDLLYVESGAYRVT